MQLASKHRSMSPLKDIAIEQKVRENYHRFRFRRNEPHTSCLQSGQGLIDLV
jgi:hypothetical protein